MYSSPATLTAIDPTVTGPGSYVVSLKPGVNVNAYASALQAALGYSYDINTDRGGAKVLLAVVTLITMLTLLIIAVAGLGVLNTVALQIRERAHDIGIFKSLGMTPRQTLTMVICSVGITGLVAGIIAVPAGILLHHRVLPAMAHAANSGLPTSLLTVYSAPEMVILALAGLVIAIAGAWPRRAGQRTPAPPPLCARSKSTRTVSSRSSLGRLAVTAQARRKSRAPARVRCAGCGRAGDSRRSCRRRPAASSR